MSEGKVGLVQEGGEKMGGTAVSFCLVIFGATGDLTHRKLIPALYHLYRDRQLGDRFRIVAFARRVKTEEAFREELKGMTEQHSRRGALEESIWRGFSNRIDYHQGSFEDPAAYQALRGKLEGLCRREGMEENYLFYLATPPEHFPEIVNQIHQAGLVPEHRGQRPWRRLIIEKPFGRDLSSARLLNQQIRRVFHEKSIYRIDHYLGKETVQNILVFRFGNSIFEPIWNHHYIDHVQITVSESIGIENRGAYYDRAGALRDIVQNHMMHLLTLVAMEPPASLEADAVRDEKVQALRSLRRISPDCAANGVVRAQYGRGTYKGQTVCGYLEEPGVAKDSRTETFAAFKVMIDNWRWSGVPFYLRTGKRMAARLTDIGIHFKAVPQVLFNTGAYGAIPPNVLSLRIQPNEGISLQFQVKRPGPAMKLEPFQMDFDYERSFCASPPDAYERLLLDSIMGDSTLFTRDDEVEAAWDFVAPILEGCSAASGSLAAYPAGSWGPKEADALLEKDGRRWDVLRRSGSPCGKKEL